MPQKALFGKVFQLPDSQVDNSLLTGPLNHHHLQVYFGTTSSSVSAATPDSPEYIGDAKGGSNIKQIPAKFRVVPGETYYWRVDAKVGKKIVKGDVWQFTAV